MKKKTKKLELAKETVRSLGETMLDTVRGGTGMTFLASCECPVSIVECLPEQNIQS